MVPLISTGTLWFLNNTLKIIRFLLYHIQFWSPYLIINIIILKASENMPTEFTSGTKWSYEDRLNRLSLLFEVWRMWDDLIETCKMLGNLDTIDFETVLSFLRKSKPRGHISESKVLHLILRKKWLFSSSEDYAFLEFYILMSCECCPKNGERYLDCRGMKDYRD